MPRRVSGVLSPLRADKSEPTAGTYNCLVLRDEKLLLNRQRQTVKENGYKLLSCMFDLWTQTGLLLNRHIIYKSSRMT